MPQQDTATVKMIGQTVHSHNGNFYRLWPGMEVTVDQATAERWVGIGLAEPARGSKRAASLASRQSFQEAEDRHWRESAPAQEVVRTDLRIGANHGDVEAARRLFQMGESVGPVGAAMEGTPPPLNLTNQGAPRQPGPDEEDEGEDDGEEDEEQQPGPSEEPNPVGDGDEGGTASSEGPRRPSAARQTTGASARSALGRR